MAPQPAQKAVQVVQGLHGSARAWLLSRLFSENSKLVVICNERQNAEDLTADLRLFAGNNSVFHFQDWDSLPFEISSPPLDLSAARMRALWELLSADHRLIVASASAVSQRLLPPAWLRQLTFSLRPGQQMERDELLKRLVACGYSRVSVADEIGQFAVRGSLVDVFTSTSPLPLRLDFKGDLLTTIRLYDADTQRSLSKLQDILILPVAERKTPSCYPEFEALLPAALERLKSRAAALETPPREAAQMIEAFTNGAVLPGIEQLQAIALEPLSTFFDYLPKDSTLVMEDRLALENKLDELAELISERQERLSAEHYLIPSSAALYLEGNELLDTIQSRASCRLESLALHNRTAGIHVKRYRSSSNIELATRMKTRIGSGRAMAPLISFINQKRRRGYEIAFVTGGPARAQRLQKTLLESGFDAALSDDTAQTWIDMARRPPLVILQGLLTAGFQLEGEKIIFIAEAEIFGERSYRRAGVSATNIKRLLGSLAQLKDGDYVVHVDYGIGIYRGLQHVVVEGAASDLLQIDYLDSRLYLPIQHIRKVQKFSAAEGKAPALDKLGSKRWASTKIKVRRSVMSLAGDLIKLYATRSIARGWRFDPEGAEDERFADGFSYNETPDQLKAIHEVLADMASDKPMDRLVCGDVGFGKTEVALRAAAKCVQHARQAAVLVPTTLLVEQHASTFTSRFAEYPVKVGALSRFYKPKDNQQTLDKLAKGEIDIVVGTHKLLSRSVKFKDLGLLIIDEEHRFGVRQKERLKQLKKQVDVLTMTATPIPRTLHMALLGIRDISLINTPPVDRRLIRTHLVTHDDTLVREAVLRELQRGGQVFFLHNRVESIEMVAAGLSQLVPEARFQVAHGQMGEKTLERIMDRFLKHQIDVLVTTTIVESGLDIPNANTIIIDRADTFGLAQLYQLRGRVGRSSRQAYAYLMIPRNKKLGQDAYRRLEALSSLDDLGIGFNLAVRDLEIRGAGNLLGGEQHGNVMLVGFELYNQILKEAILNLKGEELDLNETLEPEVKLGSDAYIPEIYIPDVSERLVLYQRLASLGSSEETDELLTEICDRFGPPCREVLGLVELMRIRSLLRQYGVQTAEFSEGRIRLALSAQATVDGEKIARLIQKQPERYSFNKGLTLTVASEAVSPTQDPAIYYAMVREVLESIARDLGEPS